MERGKKQRLLHVFPSFCIGGLQVRFTRIAHELGERFHHIILTLDGNLEAAFGFHGNIDLDVLPLTMENCRITSPKNVANIRKVHRTLKAVRPDVLLTYNFGAIEWCLINRMFGTVKRHLHFEDGFNLEEANRPFRRRVWLRQLALSKGTTIVVPSRTLYNTITQDWRFPKATVQYIPNGVDCTRFGSSAAATGSTAALLRNRVGKNLAIGFVGALRPVKRLSRLIEGFAAISRHTATMLVLVGDGPERKHLESKVQSLGLDDRVIFAGMVERPEEVYSLLDIFAMSSETEQMPMCLLEAMAFSLPIVATDVGDTKWMVAQENKGYIVPRDSGAIAAALLALAGSPEERQRVGEANRLRVQTNFDQATLISKYRKLFTLEECSNSS